MKPSISGLYRDRNPHPPNPRLTHQKLKVIKVHPPLPTPTTLHRDRQILTHAEYRLRRQERPTTQLPRPSRARVADCQWPVGHGRRALRDLGRLTRVDGESVCGVRTKRDGLAKLHRLITARDNGGALGDTTNIAPIKRMLIDVQRGRKGVSGLRIARHGDLPVGGVGRGGGVDELEARVFEDVSWGGGAGGCDAGRENLLGGG